MLSGNSPNICPLCGSGERAYLFPVHENAVFRCRGCDLIFVAGRAGGLPAQLGSKVATSYEPARCSPTEQEAAGRYLAEVSAAILPDEPLLVLAPDGHSLGAQAAEMGFSAVTALTGEAFLKTAFPKGHFAAVIVAYQWEEMTNPLLFLQQLHNRLRPEAFSLLVIQAVDSWPARFFRHAWVGWHRRRRFYFTRKTAHLLLLKAGFSNVWFEKDRRAYTVNHVGDRLQSAPSTFVTRLLRSGVRLWPRALRGWQIPLTTSGVIVTALRAALPVEKKKVSIVVPVYNERRSFSELMTALLAKKMDYVEREIIVVESNSKDGTRDVVLEYKDHPEVRLILQDRPHGKGHAVKEGFRAAKGDIVMIQDADLEYDLNDYESLLQPLLDWREPFILGARHGGAWKMRSFADQRLLGNVMNFGHVFFCGLINLLYQQRMKDPFTMYKVLFRDCLYGLAFERNHFDFDHELVIKLVRKGYTPLELPVNYASRSYGDGKKVDMFREPWRWLYVDFKNRFIKLPAPRRDSEKNRPQQQP